MCWVTMETYSNIGIGRERLCGAGLGLCCLILFLLRCLQVRRCFQTRVLCLSSLIV